MSKKWLGPFILGAFGVIILCALGIWQINRLASKENLIDQMNMQMQSAPIDYEDINWNDSQNYNAQPVHLSGKIQSEYFDILSVHSNLGPGYRRAYAFETQNGERVILELGFLPESASDQKFDIPQGEIDIDGHIYIPEKANGSYDPARNLWVGYDQAAMANLLKTKPRIITATQSPVKGLADKPMAIDLPNNHLQYAITWFLLAIAWAGMAIYWGIRRNREGT